MNQRDVEQLSSYLDGQLSPSDSARLKTRLASDPALVSTLDALRASRSLLRRLPHRRAPRNFLLTPKMVGKRPPLPRTYPVFRFATALATLLFGLSFVTNQITSLGASAPAPVPAAAVYGMGGGPDTSGTETPLLEMALATQPPAEPTLQAALLLSTATLEPTADQQNRVMEGPASPKTAAEPAPSLLTPWQMGFGFIALLGAASMFLIQKLAANKWRAK
jgi:anti-sigma factor RsiW